jgi:formamidopyrimidine-DNA glycosylase
VFPSGILHFTEAGSKRRASLHLVHGESALAIFDRGGLEPLTASPDTFAMRVRSARHTLKRALTTRRSSAASATPTRTRSCTRRLSPLQLTTNLDDAELRALHEATCAKLTSWLDALRASAGEGFRRK